MWIFVSVSVSVCASVCASTVMGREKRSVPGGSGYQSLNIEPTYFKRMFHYPTLCPFEVMVRYKKTFLA